MNATYARPGTSAPVVNEFRDWRNAMTLYRGNVYKSPIGLLAMVVAERGVLHYADFSHHAFEGGRIDGLQAPGARFNHGSMNRVMLASADLRWADFSQCKLEQVSLAGSDLGFARLPYDQLNQLDLTGAKNLETAILTDAKGEPLPMAFTPDGRLYDRRNGPAPAAEPAPQPQFAEPPKPEEAPQANNAQAGHRQYQQQQARQDQASAEQKKPEQPRQQQQSQQQQQQKKPDDGFTSWFDGFARKAKADDFKPWTPRSLNAEEAARAKTARPTPRPAPRQAAPQPQAARTAPPVRRVIEIKAKGGKPLFKGVGVSTAEVLEAGVKAKVSFKRAGFGPGELTGTGRSLKGLDLRAAGAPGAVLERCDLTDCQTYMTDFTGGRFVNVTAVGGNFEATRIEKAQFSGNFRKAKFQLAWMDGAAFENCDLEDAVFTVERLAKVTFKNCKNTDKVRLVNDTGMPVADWVMTPSGPVRKGSAGPQAARRP